MTYDWPPAARVRLKRLFASGHGYKDVMKRMGVTKGRVLGMSCRMGLGHARKLRKVDDPDARTLAKIKGEEMTPLELGVPAQLLRLHPRGCKWGVAEVEGIHIFCNKMRGPGSYCQEHAM